MTRLLQIQTSLFGATGQSSLLSDQFVEQWQSREPGTIVIARDFARADVLVLGRLMYHGRFQ